MQNESKIMNEISAANGASVPENEDPKGLARWITKITAWGLLPLFAVVLGVLCWVPQLDSEPESYVDASLSRALKVYGAARAVNAIVSVGQEVTVLGAPIGQILDPLNDLVERFSVLMEISIVSLVVQKLLVEITSDYFFKIAFTAGVGFFLFASVFRKLNLTNVAYRILLTLVFLRFAVVAMVMLSSYIDHIFLSSKINKDTIALMAAIPNDTPASTPAQPALEKKVCPWYNPFCNNVNPTQIVESIKEMSPSAIKAKVEQLVPSLVSLMGVFFFNTLFLPIMFIYSFKAMLGAIWGYQMPVVQRWKAMLN